jgi:hypothetical protein
MVENTYTPTTKLTRRGLLRLGSLAASGSLTMRFQPAMAGPFEGADFEELVPADKKLSAAWLRSLTGRGEPYDDWRHEPPESHLRSALSSWLHARVVDNQKQSVGIAHASMSHAARTPPAVIPA